METLGRVKTLIGITGSYQDATIQGYIDEVKAFMGDAGVSERVIESDSSIGVIARGVSDLWNYGSGSAELSPYFLKRCAQLSYKKGDDE